MFDIVQNTAWRLLCKSLRSQLSYNRTRRSACGALLTTGEGQSHQDGDCRWIGGSSIVNIFHPLSGPFMTFIFHPCDVRCRVYASGSSTCSRPARLVRHTTCPPINKSRTMFLTNRVSSCPHVWPFVHLSARRSNSATIASSANRYSGRIW